mmetsp:Transcript_3048/g.3415  ORF Transcript_3048/g.3415 Transcript_3048/m.3415 type:complete len:144 (+) Transcript_3048:39-470(+)
MVSKGQEVDSKTLYRELTTYIKDSFDPHYRLYQKYMLDQKLQCYKKADGAPAKYFNCIEDIDRQLMSNAESLQQKYSQVDVSDQVCQETCHNSFEAGSKYRQECLVKCAKTMKEQVVKTYLNFYDQALSGSSEYKKLKRPSFS